MPPLLDLATVLAMTGLTRVTLYRRMRAGWFPPPDVGLYHYGWLEEDIADWLARRDEMELRRGRKPKKDRFKKPPYPRRWRHIGRRFATSA